MGPLGLSVSSVGLARGAQVLGLRGATRLLLAGAVAFEGKLVWYISPASAESAAPVSYTHLGFGFDL